MKTAYMKKYDLKKSIHEKRLYENSLYRKTDYMKTACIRGTQLKNIKSSYWINFSGIVLMGHIYNPLNISTQNILLGDM